MNNLPNELVAEILKNLSQIDLDNSVDVCDYWKSLIYDGIGVHRCIGDICPRLKRTTQLPKMIPFKEIGEIGLNYLVIGDIRHDEELPNYRNAYLIKKMSFVGLIGEETFKKLVNPLNNLTCLSFELDSMNNFKFSSELQFPNLKLFKLSAVNAKNPFNFKEDNLWTNFIRIYLESYFPHLQVVHLLGVPLLSANDGKILMDALLVFLDNHKTTLKKFALFDAGIAIPVGNTIPVIPQIQMTNQLQLQLHNFQFISAPGISRVRQELNEIVKSQMNLKVYMDVLAEFDPSVIQQNVSTLVTIQLFFYNPEANISIDFGIFEECTGLKYLTLITRFGIITNTKCLPPSMESIRLLNFHMDSKDASDLVTRKWTHLLKSLEIHQFHAAMAMNQENLSVPFDAICTLLKQKTIGRVTISGLNKASLEATKLSLNENKTKLPPLGRLILERNKNSEIAFGLDYENNYVFMQWYLLERKMYILEERNQIYVDPCCMSGFDNVLF